MGAGGSTSKSLFGGAEVPLSLPLCGVLVFDEFAYDAREARGLVADATEVDGQELIDALERLVFGHRCEAIEHDRIAELRGTCARRDVVRPPLGGSQLWTPGDKH